jgi:hypothetical protein
MAKEIHWLNILMIWRLRSTGASRADSIQSFHPVHARRESTTRTGRRIAVQSRIALLPQIDEHWIVAEFNRESLKECS